jgi:16S rRNA (uracil1498-N3)-methyltransferase
LKKIFIKSILNKPGDTVFVTGEDYHHLARVLRVKPGEKFLIGATDNEFIGKITGIDKEKIEIVLEAFSSRINEKLPLVTLYFSVLKGDRNENIIQKCSEIGVSKFVPVVTKNCVVKIEEGRKSKVSRWKKIAEESAMQAGREKMPEVLDVNTFDKVDITSIPGCKIFGYIADSKKNIFEILKENEMEANFSVFIGPEGDFTEKEIDVLIKSGWKGVNVSPYIFKSDTASIFFSSLIFGYFWKA